MKWLELNEPYFRRDIECYTDPLRVDKQFCLPTPFRDRVFSSALDDCSRAARLRKGPNTRTQNMANLLAIRWIIKHDPTAWIWDERFHFRDIGEGSPMLMAQNKFVEMMGNVRFAKFKNIVSEMPLKRPSDGRPDIPTYSERDKLWRFIEAKRRAKDTLNTDQELWLGNLADFFGQGAAIELRLKLSD